MRPIWGTACCDFSRLKGRIVHKIKARRYS
jgi:hypothetical protein